MGNGTKVYLSRKSSYSEVQTGRLEVADGGIVPDTKMHGTLFSVVPNVETPRVYRVEALTINEDAMVEITATVVPLTPEGRQKVTQWSPSQFVIQGA